MRVLPGISQIRTFLKAYGAELRLLLKKNNTDHHHHFWQPRVGFEYTFPLAPLPASPLVLEDLSPSPSLGCPRRRSRVVCRGTVKPVRLSSLEVLQD